MATDYVGLDPSYTGFGIVVLHEDGEYEKFLGKFKQTKWTTTRLYDIQDWMTECLEAASAHDVRFLREGYAMGAKWGREQAGELGAAVNQVVYDWLQRDPILVQPTALKKFITGKGRVDKNQILLSVYKKWGADIDNDNVADAYGLAKLGYALDQDPSNLAKYEQEVVTAVRKSDPDL